MTCLYLKYDWNNTTANKYKYQLSLTHPHDALHHGKRAANTGGRSEWQTCDKVDNACDGQRFRVIASYLSNIVNLNLLHLHLAPRLVATPFEFCQDLRRQKTRVPGLLYAVVCMILHIAGFSRTPTCDKQTDRHMTTAYTALVWHRAVKMDEKLHSFIDD